jgi:hypothetical protein
MMALYNKYKIDEILGRIRLRINIMLSQVPFRNVPNCRYNGLGCTTSGLTAMSDQDFCAVDKNEQYCTLAKLYHRLGGELPCSTRTFCPTQVPPAQIATRLRIKYKRRDSRRTYLCPNKNIIAHEPTYLCRHLLFVTDTSDNPM